MNQVNCPVCGKKRVKSGKTKAGSQRWLCKSCKTSLTHKIDAQYVRVGIQQGVLKFGVAIKMEDSNEYNYYCPDKKVWEETGYFRSVPEAV